MRRIPEPSPKTGFSALFFVHAIAMAAWFVPLSPVLEAHGFGGLRSFAFATSAIAALVTPLLFGAIADRHASPLVVLRWVSVGSAVASALATHAIAARWPASVVLGLIQIQALVATPTWSLLTSVALAGLREPAREFGPVRAFGTFGWIAGCLLISALNADASPRAGWTAAVGWLALAATTHGIPQLPSPPSQGVRSLRERFGLDALGLLLRPEYRALFLTAGLAAIPLAAFYPFAPSHLRDLGLTRTSAWMGLAQATEILAMFALAGWTARWGTKRMLGAGLAFGVLRYLLMAVDERFAVLPGIALHGCVFTLFFVTAPICLNQTIDPSWRTRAQALLSLATQGVGNLFGYLGTGAWLAACSGPTGTRWSAFWGGLALLVAGVFAYFQAAYRDGPRQTA
ncbi:MAG: MFS transporter [Limisphaerales bacterium]